MSLTVTQRPNQFNSWVASGNPIVYKMTRKDFVITAIANSGGALQITVTGNLATLSAALGGPVIAGSKIWFKSDSGTYNALYTVVTCTNAASSVVTFTAGTYISGAGAATGYVNLISNRPIYRVEVELFKQVDNTLIFSKLLNSHNAQGDLLIDVAIINNYITQEPAALLFAGNINTVHNAPNPGSSIGFYIKYLETWTGSAEAQTNDVANPAWAVKGARQIGELYGGYLKEYSEPNATPTRKFLTKFTRLRIWLGRKFSLSYIDSEALATPRTTVRKTRYNSTGTIWGATYDLPDATGAVAKAIYEDMEDVTTPYGLRWDKDIGAGTAWANLTTATPRIVLAAAAVSKTFVIPLQLKLGQSYTVEIEYAVFAAAGAEQLRVQLAAITLAGATRWSQQNTFNQNTVNLITYTITPATSDTGILAFDVTHLGGVNARTMDINFIRITVPVVNKIDFALATLDNAIPMTETVVSETLTADIVPLFDNPVQLFWKNSLNGDSTWVFEFSQDQTYRYQDGKRKRMILYVDNITASEWEALNDLNTIGEVYEPAFNELTSSINKTHAKLGAQVYLVDATGKKTGVIVIPTEIKDRTRKIGKSMQITIELPEIQSPR